MITDYLEIDFLILATLALLVFHVVQAKIQGKLYVFDPLMFFWAGVVMIYINEPLANLNFYIVRYGESTVVSALLWVFIGLVFLHFGYAWKVGRRLGNRIPELPSQIHPGRMLAAAMILIILGCIGWWMQIMSVGSLALWAATPRGGENWEELSPYVGQLSGALMVGVGLLVLHVQLHKRGWILKILAWTMLAFLLVFFLYLGSRSRLIAVVLLGFMAWSLPKRRNPSILILMPSAIALFIAVSFQTEYRETFRDLSFNLDQIDANEVPTRILPSYLTGSPSTKLASAGTEFSMTAAVVELVPDHIPYAFGAEFLQILTQPIPRSLWPQKRYPRGELWSDVHQLAGTSEWWVEYVYKPYVAGPAPGYIASWYYNGGVLGLLIGGFITGACLRMLRTVYDRAQRNQSFAIVYLVMAPAAFGEAVSHPFNWVYFYPMILVPLMMVLKMIGSRRQTHSNAAEALHG